MKQKTPTQFEIIDPDPLADTSLFKLALEQVLTGENQICDYLNVIFMDPDQLRELKKQYFNLDVYTDVISFNLNDPAEPLEGELYLSFDQISQNALKYQTSTTNELLRVVIHGCLHLCGYEDDTPERKTNMTSLENKYLELVNLEST